jgi:putative DNA primase/helicase
MKTSTGLEFILQKLSGVRRNGAGYQARCPAHEDHNPSLSITEEDGTILLHCHAGCTTEAVCKELGIELRDLFSDEGSTSQNSRIVATYDYCDEAGNLLFQTVRFKPKSFKQRRPDGKGGWIWNLVGVRRVLFHLNDIIDKPDVIVPEGEKDVLSAWLWSLGAATCNPLGAGKWNDEYSETLRGKNVTVISDADEPGRKHALQVATSLHLRAASIKVLELPGAHDLTEWMELGGTAEKFKALVAATAIWKPQDAAEEPSARRLGRFSVAELFASKETKIEWLAWPFLAVGLSSILDGLPKLAGKTRFILEGIKASRDGRNFLDRPTEPMRVVYVSEQSTTSLAMQMREVGFTGEEPVEELMIVPREEWCRFTYLQMLDEVEELYLVHGGYNAIVLDTWHTISRLEDENHAAEVNRMGNLTLDLASRHNLALCMSRHDRKSGGDVGVSGRSSIQLSGLVDVILHLVRQPGSEATVRKLQMVGRVPGLPADQTIELAGNSYVNHGEETTVEAE